MFPILTFVSLLIALAFSGKCDAANFICPDPRITEAAEAARVKSAIFWTGKPLPGNWYAPCPIQVVAANHSGGGMTQFRFDDGEVHSWSMKVEGQRAAILQDVIPHEVDHAVRASLVRHPIERWLDEGCSTLFESPKVQQELRSVALRTDGDLIQSNWLNSYEYPKGSNEIESLYAVGFSLVEYLLSSKDAATLLEFQKQTGSIEKRLNDHYNLSITELRTGWREWKNSSQRSQIALRCDCSNRSKPLLVIWTAKWCSSCHLFWRNWNTDSNFRAAIEEHFHVHILDYDRHRGLAIKHRIQHLPTFQSQNYRIIGFKNRESLLKQLKLSASGSTPIKTPTELGYQASSDEITTLPSTEEIATSETLAIEAIPTEGESPEQLVVPSPPPESKSWLGRISHALPVGLTLLQWTGILGGTAATGGFAGFAIAMLPKLISLRKRRRKQSGPKQNASGERSDATPPCPFPRELDEAGQLLKLRQSEGRVAVLDALRGMFLEDELEKLKKSKDRSASSILNELMSAVDSRVDQVAPLSTKLS
ncbi:thioredoxin family protein [Planctomicrobium sp.]|nr:thioredoxin family protein [Planctomicrobium sp.]